MSSRAVLIFVGFLFSIYCLAVVILTVIGLNFPIFHLSSFLVAGFAAIYGVLSPIGLSGILGGLHRRRNLIKGFIFQYWFASGLIIGIGVANILLSGKFHDDAIRKCQSALFGTVPSGQNTSPVCIKKVRSSENAALIFASVQGAVLLSFGILVLFFGIKEFKDILLEEETRNLLERAKFQGESRNSSSDTESNVSGNSNNANSTENGRYASSASVSRASSRSDHSRHAQKVTTTVPVPYAGPNRSTNRVNVTTERGAPPGHYQQQIPPKNNYPSSNTNNYPPISNKNNYPPSTSNKNSYPLPSNNNNYPPSSSSKYLPPSSNINYPPSSKSNSSPINGSSRSGHIPSNKSNSSPINGSSRSGHIPSNNYSSQPLPLGNYTVASPERSYAMDRYGTRSPPPPSNLSSYSSPSTDFVGKSKSSVRKPTVQTSSSNRNYPPNTRQPAMISKPSPMNINNRPSANRPQQPIQTYDYPDDYSEYSYSEYSEYSDYNDYVIPSNTYNIRQTEAKTYAPNLTRGNFN